jgi:hypothetical protein
MKAIKYKIKISESLLADIHGFHQVIDEVAIDYLGAIVNHTGIYFPEDLDVRVAAGTDAEEVEVPSDVLDVIEEIRDIKEKVRVKEPGVIKKLGLEITRCKEEKL